MNFLKRTSQWLVTLLVPVILVLGVVRLLLTPLFVRLEYRTPNFPPDSYGFTREERLKWAEVARRYLLNDAGIEYLGDLRFEDGTPLYNERELRHMVDVKMVIAQALRVWYAALLGVALVGVWASRGGWWWDYRLALSRGGWLTAAMLVGLMVFMALAFDALFVAFHRIFFEGNTWIFRYSDTLIRLFPVRFWRDAFISVGGLSLLGGVLVGWFAARPRRA